jgi:hypothetical protein
LLIAAGQGQIDIPDDDPLAWWGFFTAEGGAPVDLKGTVCPNRDAIQNGFQDLLAFAKAHASSSTLYGAFLNDQIGGAVLATQLVSAIKVNPQASFSFAALPSGSAGPATSLALAEGWSISAQSKYPDATQALVGYLSSLAVQADLANTVAFIPAAPVTLSDPQLTGLTKLAMAGKPYPQVRAMTFYADAFRGPLQQLLQGTINPEIAASTACAALNKAVGFTLPGWRHAVAPVTAKEAAPPADGRLAPPPQVAASNDLTITISLLFGPPSYDLGFFLDPHIRSSATHSYRPRSLTRRFSANVNVTQGGLTTALYLNRGLRGSAITLDNIHNTPPTPSTWFNDNARSAGAWCLQMSQGNSGSDNIYTVGGSFSHTYYDESHAPQATSACH